MSGRDSQQRNRIEPLGERPRSLSSRLKTATVLNNLRWFARNQSGSTVVTFALALLPTMGLMGAALDYSRAGDARANLQSAADAAALAGALAARNETGDPVDAARKAYAAHTRDIVLEAASDRLVIKDGIYRFEAEGKLSNKLFSALTGGTKIVVAAEATYGNEGALPLEIAFVFDASNSMAMFGSSWGAAVDAVIDTLEDLKSKQKAGEIFVTLVPFADRVKLPSWQSTWMNSPSQPSGWNGCLEPRQETIGATSWALTDKAPTGAYRFNPSMNGSYIANHIGSRLNPKGSPYCAASPMAGPTENIATIETALRGMRAGGTGRFDEAIAWGWRAVSENWAGYWGLTNYPAKADERRKVVVFMSDGHTTAYDDEVGGSAGKSFGWNNGSAVGFQHFVDVCTRMKEQNIEVFTFWTGGNTNFQSYMKSCATSEQTHFAHIYNTPTFVAAMAKVSGGSETVQTSQVRLIK